MGLIKTYETGQLLGTGSMGSVYRARDIVLDRDVALKILHFGGDLDREFKERFYREARASASLRHPNVVVVHELDEHHGSPFLTMELLDGADLRQYIAERRPLSLVQKVELLAQTCDGLAEAHRRGFVHWNLKPGNIFIHERGTAKILDFGMAGLPSSKLEIAGKVMGTPNYLAPEQISRRQCDSRSDLFSLGIVAFEFLVDSHPFQSTFIPRRIVVGDPDELMDRDPLIPQSLVDLLHRALQKRPEDRIQTAEDFAAGLRAVLHELRTGLAAEPVIQSASTLRPLDLAPVDEEGADSPAGRLASFVQMLCDFDSAANAGDIALAKVVVEDMVRLEAVDQRFSEALSECRCRMEMLQDAPQTAAKSAAAAVGAFHFAYSAQDSAMPLADPNPFGLFPELPGSLPWNTAHEVVDHQTANAVAEPPSRPSLKQQPSHELLCGYCGAPNRDTSVHCENCGDPLDQPRRFERLQESPLGHGEQALKWLREKRLEWQPVLSRKYGEILGEANRLGERARTEFMALPRNAQYAVAGVLGVGLTAVIILMVLSLTKPVPVEKALGTAAVHSSETPLMESNALSSRRLEVLPRGTRLHVLGHIKDPGQRMVRVQVVLPKPRRPGFVALADIGQLSSGDPAVAWEYLGLRRFAAAATPHAAREYSQALAAFSERFPGTPQAKVAALEQVQIHLELAKQAKAAGRNRAEWQGDLDEARKSLDAAGIEEPSPEEEKRLFATPADFTTWVYKTRTKQLLEPARELKTVEQPAVHTERAAGADTPANTGNSVEVASLLRRTSAAWHKGDLDSCELNARKALELDPGNRKAKAWIWQVEQARRQ